MNRAPLPAPRPARSAPWRLSDKTPELMHAPQKDSGNHLSPGLFSEKRVKSATNRSMASTHCLERTAGNPFCAELGLVTAPNRCWPGKRLGEQRVPGKGGAICVAGPKKEWGICKSPDLGPRNDLQRDGRTLSRRTIAFSSTQPLTRPVALIHHFGDLAASLSPAAREESSAPAGSTRPRASGTPAEIALASTSWRSPECDRHADG